MTPTRPFRLVAALAVIAACWPVVAAETLRESRAAASEALKAAKRGVIEIPEQAEILVGLAWPIDGSSDPVLQALAREDLTNYGSYAMPALRRAVKTVDPIYRADVTAVLVDARKAEDFGTPPDFWPGLEEAIWFGSVEAQRLGMIELSRYPFPPAVLTIVDSVHRNPELMLPALRALHRLRNDRARHFLRRVLLFTEPPYQQLAADAIAQLGDPIGVPLLRDAARSNRREVRQAAMIALLPWTSPDDLTLLYEYVEQHPKDDETLLEAIRTKSVELEAALDTSFDD